MENMGGNIMKDNITDGMENINQAKRQLVMNNVSINVESVS